MGSYVSNAMLEGSDVGDFDSDGKSNLDSGNEAASYLHGIPEVTREELQLGRLIDSLRHNFPNDEDVEALIDGCYAFEEASEALHYLGDALSRSRLGPPAGEVACGVPRAVA